MDFRLFFSVAAAKLSILACKLFRRSGTSLSGRIALKLDHDVLKKLSDGVFIIMVTGTNGKTTTTKMISAVLDRNGIAHVTNRSGANLVGGVISVFIRSAKLQSGRWKCPVNTALIEVDEAAFRKVTDLIQPDILVVNNFFRDQLDRYGELINVVDKVKEGIRKSPNARLVLNADDSLCAYLGKESPNPALYFGFDAGAAPDPQEKTVITASHCIFCKTKYDYSYKVYGHLGGFRCPGCGFRQPRAEVRCTKVEALQSECSEIRVWIEGHEIDITVNTPGMYNVYNALAAMSCASLMGLPVEKTREALSRYVNSFGRMETIPAGGKNIKVILAKNPTGFNQVLNYLYGNDKVAMALIINDNAPDGEDISWLWDVNFERLARMENRLSGVTVSGVRGEDMAVRLKYAGVPAEKIRLEKDYGLLIDQGLDAVGNGETFYVVANYTAMMDMRRMLKNRYGLKEFWE